MKLYDLDLSGNCYKVRLLCSLLDVPLELRPVDFMAGEHKTDAFVALNPFGELPVLEDGELLLRDSQSMLVYVAKTYGDENWLPSDPTGLALVTQWLSSASNDIARGPNDARLHVKFNYELDVEKARRIAIKFFGILEQHLTGRNWLELRRPTIADIAVYPYVSIAHEGGISLQSYPAIRAWMKRIRELPRYISMPGQDLAA